MKRSTTIRIAAIAAALALSVQAAAAASGTSTAGAWGATAALADSDLTVEDMLTYALQDEYLARAEYVAIMARFGVARPFSNIKESEDSHIAWLGEAFAARAMALPADAAAPFVVMPNTLKEAFEAGVSAEVANIAMYDSFLAEPEMKDGSNNAIRDLFTRLRRASENHLRAFRTQLGKY